jgi:ligand-binding SRPBCC domain-containing protein
MAIHVLEHSQIVRASLEECWAFFSDPRNLAKITPEALDFVILSDLPERMHQGLMIQYRVRPLLGIPMTWLTEITHVKEPNYFVDEQRVGPYRIWHHEHFFKQLDDGRVELRDRVHYVLPFSPFSEIVHPFVVAPELKKIFAHREKAVRERFGE